MRPRREEAVVRNGAAEGRQGLGLGGRGDREKEEGGPGGRKRMGALVAWVELEVEDSRRLSSTGKWEPLSSPR